MGSFKEELARSAKATEFVFDNYHLEAGEDENEEANMQRLLATPDKTLKAKLVVEYVQNAVYYECDDEGEVIDDQNSMAVVDEPFYTEYQVWLGSDEKGYTYERSYPLNKMYEAIKFVKQFNNVKEF